MKKTLCVGGSFNPIHHGHLICARAAAEKGNFEQILLIPSSQPPHKPGDANLADAAHRLAMTELAVQAHDTFAVDGLEISRSGPSYTIETARLLKQKGMEEVHWLIGADLLTQFHLWHNLDALLREVTFWVIQRPGYSIDWPSLSPPIQALQQRLLVAPMIDISATDIRHRVALAQPIDFLTPAPVVAYIREKRLYIPK